MKNQLPSQDELLKIFKYDPQTGDLHKRFSKSGRLQKVGSILKNEGGKSYYRVRVSGYGRKEFLSHRIIFKMVFGQEPFEIDHVDGNGLNNALENIRNVNTVVNHQNTRLSTRNTSGVVGVSLTKCKKKWRARIRVNKVNLLLGVFDNFEDAVRCRMQANVDYSFHENHGSLRPL